MLRGLEVMVERHWYEMTMSHRRLYWVLGKNRILKGLDLVRIERDERVYDGMTMGHEKIRIEIEALCE